MKNKKKKVLIIILSIVLIILGTVAFITYRSHKNGGGLQGLLSTMVGHNEETLKDLPEMKFLLMGESGNLTDTIMVCSYDPKMQSASILSIPRDTFVGKNKNKATGGDKINAIYQRKYPEKVVKAVNDVTGLDLKYYIAIDTKALVELVDAIGGVKFNVPIDMNYDDNSQKLHIHLKAGEQLLDGNKTEQVLRFRHNNDGTTYPSDYGEQDIGRMRTQREFIKETIKQTMQPHNVLKIKKFIDIANENVNTNIDINVAKDYIPYAVNYKTENLKTEVLPGVPEKCNNVWIYTVNKKEAQNVIDELFPTEIAEESNNTSNNTNTNKVSNTTKTADTSVSKNLKVQLLNGTGSKSKLSEVTALLKEKGYNVTKTGTAQNTSKTTIINRTGKSSQILSELKDVLGVGTISTGKNNSNVDITVIIGKDYK